MTAQPPARSAPAWEVATVRVVQVSSNADSTQTSTRISVCRAGQQPCQEQTVNTPVSWRYQPYAVDGGLTTVLNALGQEGFEVVSVIPGDSTSSSIVLLKRRVPTS